MITKEFDASKHDRDAFDCGEESVNNFFKKNAKSWSRKRLTSCWVLEDQTIASDKVKVKGFYLRLVMHYRTVDKLNLGHKTAD